MKKEDKKLNVELNDEVYLMVTQLHWEDDIIWNVTDDIKTKVLSTQKTKGHAAGWIPSTSHRTAKQFIQSMSNWHPGILKSFHPYRPQAFTPTDHFSLIQNII